MRFSNKYKFIYLANPKTGSTSVRSMLDTFSEHQRLIDSGRYHDHWSSRQYKQVFEDMGWDWHSYYRFLTIRNPWKKYVSNYYFSKPDQNFVPFYLHNYDSTTAFKHDFKVWVKHYHIQMSRFPPGCPPLKLFAFSNGEKLVDDIFPIETFAETALPIIQQRTELPLQLKLGHLNASKKPQRDYRAEYDDESAQIIATACQLDMEIGGYQWQAANAA